MRAILFVLLPFFLFAKVHHARIEPIERLTIKSTVSGKVLLADRSQEGKVIQGVIVHIDDSLDKKALQNARFTQKSLKSILALTRKKIALQKEILQRAARIYNRSKNLSALSQQEKDKQFEHLAALRSQLLALQEKIVTLRRQLDDLRYKIATLQKRIKDKTIAPEGYYLYKLLAKEKDVVAPGAPLAIVDDVRRAKVTLFLDAEELRDIEKRSVTINGKHGDFKISKVWKVADDQYLSQYRVEITLPADRFAFSQLVEVELK